MAKSHGIIFICEQCPFPCFIKVMVHSRREEAELSEAIKKRCVLDDKRIADFISVYYSNWIETAGGKDY
jgi:hypothetical protein